MAGANDATKSPTANYVDFDEFIDFQIEKTRSQIRWTEVCTALLGTAALFVGWLLLFVVFDQWVIRGGFSATARIVMLGVVSSVMLGVLTRHVFLPLSRRINSRYAARTLEHADPQLKSNLLNFVDAREAGAVPTAAVLRAMEKRAAVGLSQVDVEHAVNRRPLLYVSYVLLATVIAACLYVVLSPKDVFSSVKRALLPTSPVSVATQTTISDVAPGNDRVPARSPVTVEADIRGRVPERVEIRFTTLDQKFVDQPVEMRRIEEGLPRFRGVILGESGRGVLQDFSYCVVAGDARTVDYKVEVVQPPSAEVLDVQYSYPAYTQLENKTTPGGTIDGWAGTLVTVRARASMPVKSARVLFYDTDDAAAESVKGEELRLDVVDGTQLRGQWKLQMRSDGTYARSYTIDVRTERGERDPAPTRQSITIRPDQPPQVALLAPTGDLERPANAVIPLVIQAEDPDFGLKTITLRMEQDGETVLDQRLFEDEELGTSFRGHYDLALEPLKLKAGDQLQFWVEAKDTRHPGPNRGATARLNLRILEPVSPEEVKQELARDRQEQQDQLAQVDPPQNEGGEQDAAPEKQPGDRPDDNPRPREQPVGEEPAAQPGTPEHRGEENDNTAAPPPDGGDQKPQPKADDAEALQRFLDRLKAEEQQEQSRKSPEEPNGQPEQPNQGKPDGEQGTDGQGAGSGESGKQGQKGGSQSGKQDQGGKQGQTGSEGEQGGQTSAGKTGNREPGAGRSGGGQTGARPEPKPGENKPGENKPAGKTEREKSTGAEEPGRAGKAAGEKPDSGNEAGMESSGGEKPSGEKPSGEKPTGEKATGEKPAAGGKTGSKAGTSNIGNKPGEKAEPGSNEQPAEGERPQDGQTGSAGEKPSGMTSGSEPKPGATKAKPGADDPGPNAAEGEPGEKSTPRKPGEKAQPGTEPKEAGEPSGEGEKNGAKPPTGGKPGSGETRGAEEQPGAGKPGEAPRKEPGMKGKGPGTKPEPGSNDGMDNQGSKPEGDKSEGGEGDGAGDDGKTEDGGMGGEGRDPKRSGAERGPQPGSGAGRDEGEKSESSPMGDGEGGAASKTPPKAGEGMPPGTGTDSQGGAKAPRQGKTPGGRGTGMPPEGGEERPAEDSPDAVPQQATGNETGEGVGEQNPERDPVKAKNKIARKPGSAEGARRPGESDRNGDGLPDEPSDVAPNKGTAGSDAPEGGQRPGQPKMGRPGAEKRPGERVREEGGARGSDPATDERRPAENRGGQPDAGDDEMRGEGRPGGQKSQQPDGGEAGGSKANQDGNSGGEQRGPGEQGQRPGEGAERKSGTPGDGPGEGRPGERGEGKPQPGGKSPGGKSPGGKSPGEPANGEKSPGGKPQGGQSGSESGGEDGGESGGERSGGQGSGRAGRGSSGREGGGVTGPGEAASGDGNGSEQGAGNGPGAGDGEGAGEGTSPEESAAANLEYQKKASNLVLNRLKEQMERGEVDQELLEELGWTEADLKQFVDRLEQQVQDSGDDQSPEAIARRVQYEEMLRTMSLRGQTEKRTGEKTATRRTTVTTRQAPVPAEFREQYEAYTRSLSKQKGK